MSQYAQPMKNNNYVLAGDQVLPLERIVVSKHVDVPDSPVEQEDARVPFKAGERREAKRFGVSLPWAALLIGLAIVIMSVITLNTAQQESALRDEIAQLQNKYTAFERERLVLDGQLSEAKDSNLICYYASQNLGMKLALHEETVQVVASGIDPSNSAWGKDIGMASGRR